MKSKIKKLPKKVYDKIAAGEIIDRPSSILRELLDNSIDAGSTEITVNLTKGGLEAIEVIDNGSGMNEQDIKLCCQPFTTSKINTFEDLLDLHTYGFRGEALNSISTISRVEIISKTDEDEMATAYLIEGGEEITFNKCMRNKGTTILVSNIFFNIPARLKSLKSAQSEFLSSKDIIINKALPNKNVHFKMYNNGDKKLDISANTNLVTNIGEIYGSMYKENLINISNTSKSEYGNIKIHGYIGNTDLLRPNRSHQFFFVNSRPIFSPSLSRAVSIAYNDIAPRGRFPVVFLFIDLPKDFIDINVHPAKKEVRFVDEKLIVSRIISIIKNKFTEIAEITNASDDIREYVKANESTVNEFINTNTEGSKKQIEYSLDDELKEENQRNKYIQQEFNNVNDTKQNIIHDKSYLKENYKQEKYNNDSNIKIIGTAFDSYILIENGDDIVIIDQHIAHKKIIYERLFQKYSEIKMVSQTLLLPILIDTLEDDIKKYLNNSKKIAEFGFDFDKFGSNAVTVRSIPEFMNKETDPENIKFIFDDICSSRIKNLEDFIKILIHKEITSQSIKKGNRQNHQSINQLINDLYSSDSPFSLFNNKKVAIKLSKNDIKKLF